MKTASIEPLLKAARSGQLQKVKDLLSKYSYREAAQVLRACIANNNQDCVEYLVPIVAASHKTDINNMRFIEHAFITSITMSSIGSFNTFFKYIDFQKNDSVFLSLACQYRNQDMIERLMNVSDIEKTWETMVQKKPSRRFFCSTKKCLRSTARTKSHSRGGF